jgi:hypothetical protein
VWQYFSRLKKDRRVHCCPQRRGPAQANDTQRVRPSLTQWQSPGGAEVLQWLFLKVLVPAPSHCRSSVLPKA